MKSVRKFSGYFPYSFKSSVNFPEAFLVHEKYPKIFRKLSLFIETVRKFSGSFPRLMKSPENIPDDFLVYGKRPEIFRRLSTFAESVRNFSAGFLRSTTSCRSGKLILIESGFAEMALGEGSAGRTARARIRYENLIIQ
ncbi:MAG: hypothetical protein LBC81_02960 [Tannerellaceae bacterium]|jgi:hypothetical protein|nr:hypothetical protein [Tannerellaceae bacterium]